MGGGGEGTARGGFVALGFSGEGEGLAVGEEKKAVIWLCLRRSGERPLLRRRDDGDAIGEGGRSGWGVFAGDLFAATARDGGKWRGDVAGKGKRRGGEAWLADRWGSRTQWRPLLTHPTNFFFFLQIGSFSKLNRAKKKRRKTTNNKPPTQRQPLLR